MKIENNIDYNISNILCHRGNKIIYNNLLDYLSNKCNISKNFLKTIIILDNYDIDYNMIYIDSEKNITQDAVYYNKLLNCGKEYFKKLNF